MPNNQMVDHQCFLMEDLTQKKENKNGVGIVKRALQNGGRRPVRKCDLCTLAWMESDLLTTYCPKKASRTSARNSRYLSDCYPKITHDSLSSYQIPTLKQLMLLKDKHFLAQAGVHHSSHQATLTTFWLFVFIRP